MSKYKNMQLNLVPSQGGSDTVAIASNVGRGGGGTSIPCKQVWMVARSSNTGEIRVNIGSACAADTGIPVPDSKDTTENKAWNTNYLNIPIDDVASLYFYGGTNGDDVDILYTQ